MGILKFIKFDPVKRIEHNGIRYKRVKTFKSEHKAEVYLSRVNKSCRSKRYQAFIEQVKIGPGMGYIYRICVPKNMEVKDL